MFAEGFKSAKIMAQRIVALFLLSRQLLSMQQHYEWGLRSLKPILSLAGRLLQDHKRNHDEPPNNVEEAILLIKAVKINTMSKLTFADAQRFQDLCVDLFPGVTVKDMEYAELEIHIREAMEEMQLKDIDTQIAKMLQFHEACNQRMGVGGVWALWLREVNNLESARKCLQEAAQEVRRAHHEPQIHGQGPSFGAETDNLRFASPATISRLSVIFLSEEDVDVKPMIASWIAQQPPECQGSLATWFDSIFHRALDWIYKAPGGVQLATETTTLGMLRNVLGHMVPGQKKDIGEDEEFLIAKTDLLLAVCRGFAGNLPADLRHTLVREVCKWAGESLPDSNNPLNFQLSDGQLVRYEDGIGGTNVTF